MSTTFDPAGKDAEVALSNGNLTVTLSSVATGRQVYSNEAVDTDAVIGDKYYFEVHIDSYPSGSSMQIGVDGDGYGGGGFQSTLDSIGRVSDGISVSWLDSPFAWQYETGISVVMVAVDTTTRRVWFGLDGTWRGDPVAGTGYSAYTVNGAAGSAVYVHVDMGSAGSPPIVTGQFSLQDQIYPPPTGYRAFDYLSSGYPSITGRTLAGGVPVASKPVYLYALESGGALVTSTTSDGSGNYSFTTLYQNTDYIVVAHDPTDTYEPVALSVQTGSAGSVTADLDFTDCRRGDAAPVSYDLVLSSPYTAPAGNLLVLRSASDVAPITATIDATEAADTVEITAVFTVGAIVATIDATEAPDVVAIEVVHSVEPCVATIDALETADTVEIEATYTPQWVATVEAVEAGDTALIEAHFFPFEFPTTGYGGFLNATEAGDVVEDWTVRVVYDVSATIDALESPDVVEIFGGFQSVIVRETLVVSDRVSTLRTAFLADTLSVADRIGKAARMRVQDTLYLHDALASKRVASRGLANTLQVHDAILAHRSAALADTLSVRDALPVSALALAALHDTLTVRDTLSGIAAKSLTVIETLHVHDTSVPRRWAVVADTLHVQDTLAGNSAAIAPVLQDTLHLSDTLAGVLAVYAPGLHDTLHVHDTATVALHAVGVLSSTLVVGDTLVQHATLVHVVNAETGAVSTYTFTPTVVGMAEYRGVLYLAGPDGLYAMDADEDEDGAVVWTLRTGFSNLGTDLLKRIADVNVLAQTRGDTTLAVTHNRTGDKATRSYRLPPLTRNSHRDGVVHPGKGPTSVYWQFELQGVGPTEIHQLRLAVEPLSRRR